MRTTSTFYILYRFACMTTNIVHRTTTTVTIAKTNLEITTDIRINNIYNRYRNSE